MYREMKPDVVIHLAAVVGGIGANRENPGRFFYANMAMGLHLIEHARRVGLKKFVQVGTICAYPKFTPVPFREEDLWNGYPEETNAPYGIAKKALLVMLQAYRQQYGLNGIYLLPVNLYGPGDNFDPNTFARDSRPDPQVLRGQGARRGSGGGLGHRPGAAASSSTSRTVPGPSCWPRSATTSPNRSISGPASRSRSAIWPKRFAVWSAFEGKLVWDETKPDGQPRRCLDTSRAAAEFGFRAAMPFDEGLRRTIEWWEGAAQEGMLS